MPKRHGKHHAGAAPKTAPHPLWYKPSVGAWLGSAKDDWPGGPTEFTVTFHVPGPAQAHFALQYTADHKVSGASLNGKPLAVGRNQGFAKFGGDMTIVAPQGKGLFVQGKNTLSIVLEGGAAPAPGSGKSFNHGSGHLSLHQTDKHVHHSPAGLYVRGEVVVGGAVKVAGDGIRNEASTWACVHEGQTWPHVWSIERGSLPATYRIRTTGHGPSKQPAGWGLAAFRFSTEDGIRNGSSSYVAVHDGDKWSQDWYFEAGSRPNTYRIRTAGHAASKQPAGWGLTAFRFSANDGIRNSQSTWVAVHDGDAWPHDWVLEAVRDP